MKSMEVIINGNCVGCGLCEDIAGGIFKVGENGLAKVIAYSHYDKEKIKEVIENCPVTAIEIKDKIVEKKLDSIKVCLENSTYSISDGVRYIKVTINKEGRINLSTKEGRTDFVFINSKPEMVKGIARLLLKAASI